MYALILSALISQTYNMTWVHHESLVSPKLNSTQLNSLAEAINADLPGSNPAKLEKLTIYRSREEAGVCVVAGRYMVTV